MKEATYAQLYMYIAHIYTCIL